MKIKVSDFDIAEYLKTPEDINAFLDEAAKIGDDLDYADALETGVRAMRKNNAASSGRAVYKLSANTPFHGVAT